MSVTCVVSKSLEAARKQAQAFAEGTMTAAVQIKTQAPKPVFDYATGSLVDPDVVLYEGKARVERITGASQMVLGEEVEFTSSTVVEIPMGSPLPQVDDLVTVTASPDPAVLGRTFRVIDVEGGGDLPTAIRMNVVGTQRARRRDYA